MNDKLASLFRHAITAIPALFAGLVTNGFLTGEEAAKLDADLKVFLMSLAAVLAAAISRWVMRLIAEHAPHLSSIFGGASGGNTPLWAMTAATWGSILAGACLMSSCVVGVDAEGGWSIKPDPRTVDAGLRYLIRQDEESAKSGLVQWEYFDPETGEKIPPEDYASWGIAAGPAQ